MLDYRIAGRGAAEAVLPTLRRFLALFRHKRFVRSLFPPDPRIGLGILTLRVQDALIAGASQRDIAGALFGEARTAAEWNGRSDSLCSRVRRLVRKTVAWRRAAIGR